MRLCHSVEHQLVQAAQGFFEQGPVNPTLLVLIEFLGVRVGRGEGAWVARIGTTVGTLVPVKHLATFVLGLRKPEQVRIGGEHNQVAMMGTAMQK